MPKPTRQSRRYMPGLDGLRAVAVLAVIFYHLNFNWASGGLLGVTVFFVLSGYLITDLLMDEWSKSQSINLKKFWIRRFRRLVPAMIAMMLVVTAWATFFDQSLLYQLRKDFIPALLYFSNWWYIFRELSYFESFDTPSLFTHFWSLAIEEQFYILWPILLVLGLTYIKERKKRFLFTMIGAIISAIAMAVIYQPGTDPSRVYYGTDTRAFSLLIGASLAMIWPSQKLASKITKGSRFLLDVLGGMGLSVFLLMVYFVNHYDAFLYRGGMFLLSLTTAILIAVLAHPASLLGKLMSIKPLRFIGVRSYGMYLWHYPVIILTTSTVHSGQPNLIRAIIQLAMIVLLSSLSWKFIENPIRKGAIKKGWNEVRSGYWGLKNISPPRWIAINSIIFVIISAGIGLYIAPTIEASSKNKVVKEMKETSHLVEKNAQVEKNKGKEEARVENGQQESHKAEVDEKESVMSEKQVTVIGDSVVIDAAPFLKEKFSYINIDAKIGRQMSEVDSILLQLEKEGQLGEVIIISLGTNGPFNKKHFISILESLNQNKKVFLVNTRVPRPWESTVNEDLNEIAQQFSNIRLINWYEMSVNEPSYFAADGVHLTRTGAENYATFIAQQVEKGSENKS